MAVLLMAISAGNTAQGIRLVLAFGAGGALALMAVGILFVKASGLLNKIPSAKRGGIAAASACIIMLVGVVNIINAYK